ncbi:MAG TPA: hypothetical protein VD794_03785, partial [Flavisolibacter sp.]|nr:hypothetical protein [Flavisolibacter sp.]
MLSKLVYIPVLCFFCQSFAQTPVTAYNITGRTATATTNSSRGWGREPGDNPSGTTYLNFYGQSSTGAGSERVVLGFTVGTVGYLAIPSANGKPFDKVILKRHGSIPGKVVNTLYEYESQIGSSYYFHPSYLGTLEEVLNTYDCNRGSDNTFANPSTGSATYSNIERIDLLKTEGVDVIEPLKQGFLINDRNGNDNFKVAAITNIDGAGNVTGLGNLVAITTANWGRVGPSIRTA